MSDDNNNQITVPPSPVMIHKQYLKDFSFENPNAPEILEIGENRPDMDMNIGMDVKRHETDKYENYYEVILTINASAVRDGKAMFVAEIVYAATVSIEGMDEKQHHPLLLVDIPQLLFPYARQLLSNITHAGGFMPLQLRPVDFKRMYLERFGTKNSDEQEQ